MTDAGARQTFPVTLLTGFLGSGKTTLLNRLLAQPDAGRIAIVINEFGEIAIDHLLVAKSSDDIVELTSGCLCCAVRSDLVHTLFGLFAARVRGDISPFDRVLIETSGLAEPAPILYTLFTDPALAPRFRLDNVVTTVDAVNGIATLDNHGEAVKQAAAADRLLLTKTDLVSPQEIEALERRLHQLNPSAPQTHVTSGDVPARRLFGNAQLPRAFRREADLQCWMGAASHHQHHHDHPHDQSHVSGGDRLDGGHAGDVFTQSVVFDEPLSWANVVVWINALRDLKGPGLLRIKGIANISERPGEPLVLHAVQEVFHPPVFLREWPSDDRRTRLVFISRGIGRQTIDRTLPLLGGGSFRDAISSTEHVR